MSPLRLNIIAEHHIFNERITVPSNMKLSEILYLCNNSPGSPRDFTGFVAMELEAKLSDYFEKEYNPFGGDHLLILIQKDRNYLYIPLQPLHGRE